jgi:hypothetical protein
MAEKTSGQPKFKSSTIWRQRLAKLGLQRISALLGPAAFSITTGHFRSAILDRPTDRNGTPLPWYTFPAIRFLSQFEYHQADILEFGGGQSTSWWAKRARSVVTLDPHQPWAEWLSRRVPSNVAVHHLQNSGKADTFLGDRLFDVIVVDAGSEEYPYDDRVENMRLALNHMKPAGFILVDNSTEPYCAEIATIARENALNRIDFIGFAPGGVSEYGTSLFFREFPPLLKTPLPPRVIIKG